MVIITPETKLQDLLKKYPFLKEELPKINKKFRMLKTPIAKVMLRKADINEMSKRSGIEVNELILKLNEIIAKYD